MAFITPKIMASIEILHNTDKDYIKNTVIRNPRDNIHDYLIRIAKIYILYKQWEDNDHYVFNTCLDLIEHDQGITFKDSLKHNILLLNDFINLSIQEVESRFNYQLLTEDLNDINIEYIDHFCNICDIPKNKSNSTKGN